MKKSKISSYFILLSILTFVTVFVSMVQKSYFSLMKPQKVIENNNLLKEINPKIDLSVLSTIESKNKNIDETFDFSILNKDSDTSSPEPTIAPTATPTVEPTTQPVTNNGVNTILEPTP